MLVDGTIDSGLLFVECQGIIGVLNVSEFIQKDILISTRVTLGIHSFGNGVGHEGGDFAASKFNVIDTRV